MQTIYYIDRYGNIDRTGFRYKKTPTVKIYPVTLTNLIGVYGNFERDSNGDGLADGWLKTSSCSCELINGVVGTKAQKATTSADSGQIVGLSATAFKHGTDFVFPAGTCLFFTGYARKVTDNVEYSVLEIKYFKISDSTWYWVSLKFPELGDSTHIYAFSDTNWHKGRTKFCVTDSDFKVECKLLLRSNGTDEQSVAMDGLVAYNLTNMGVLPLPLQELYEVETWADLDADTLAQLLPYTDSVTSLGFAWESDV